MREIFRREIRREKVAENGPFYITLVHPGGTLTRTVFFFCNRRLTSSVCWALCTSTTNSSRLNLALPDW